MKYKSCCGRRCLLGSCETRDVGGCYCVCCLKDLESSLTNIISGSTYRQGNGIIYIPGREIPLKGKEKEETLKELDEVREKLKKYEIKEE